MAGRILVAGFMSLLFFIGGCDGENVQCPDDLGRCDDRCVDIRHDPENCGACDVVCSEGEFCVEGECASSCPPGQNECDGTCRDLLLDPANCGDCGLACGEGEHCVDGACSGECGGGQVECDGICRDLEVDPGHCGSCGTVCSGGEMCVVGECQVSCGAGMAECEGNCRNLVWDPGNCGACGIECDDGEVCSGGECSTRCGGGLAVCDGICRDLATDRNNCGDCGIECSPGEVCSDGECGASCGGGLNECDGVCRDLNTDRYNCGECGSECAEGEVCFEGLCGVSCGGGLAECDGICRDLDTDRFNCGGCGLECSEGEVCFDGVCDVSCGAGLTNCEGVCRDLSTDRGNCGACDNECHEGEVCSEGTCAVSCGAGLSECVGVCRDLVNDRYNCGGCGLECADGEVCSEGLCGLTCGGATPTMCGDACVDTDIDPFHCGACDASCAAGEACVDGLCELSCGGATPTLCGEGCVNTSVDRDNCGGCFAECAAGEVCSDGECGLECGGATPELCDDACVDLDTDRLNCGECGVECADGEVCSDGECGLSCGGTTPTRCGDACVDIDTDRFNCGGCGESCGSGEVCSGGECQLSCGGATPTLCDDRCVDTASDRVHCGGCDAACAAGEVCSEGECGLSCGGVTSELCGDACVSPDTDRNHCGGCDRACAAGEVCSGGECQLSCGGATPTRCGDRCVDTEVDWNFCGDCETSCEPGEVCSEGECSRSCGGVTPTLCGDRCVDIETDWRNCGECDNDCDAGEVCVAGECQLTCGGATPTRCGDRCVDTERDRNYCGDCDTACGAGELCVDGECELVCVPPLEACGDACVNTLHDPNNCGACGVECIFDGPCVVGECPDGVVGEAGVQSCSAILAENPDAEDGIYTIQPDPDGMDYRVYCDMTTDGGGWTLVASNAATLSDEAMEYRDNLTTLSPGDDGARGVWNGLRPSLSPGHDIRFACKSDAEAEEMGVDLVFYDVDWYHRFTRGSDAESCFTAGEWQQPAPARRNVLADTSLPLGDEYEATTESDAWYCVAWWGGWCLETHNYQHTTRYLEGEPHCSHADFMVDYDVGRLRDLEPNDTSWGASFGESMCGGWVAGGAYFIFVRDDAACADDDDCEAGGYCADGACEYRESCLELLEHDESSTSGYYNIWPADNTLGRPIGVYCDMDTDGGGYTFSMRTGDSIGSTDAREYCAERGMQLFVPRTPAHLGAAYDLGWAMLDQTIEPWNPAEYRNVTGRELPPQDRFLRYLGIYATEEGASCANTPFNSESCLAWQASDGGPYYVSTRDDIAEPVGEALSTELSMVYRFTGTGVESYTEADDPDARDTQAFLCSVGDKMGECAEDADCGDEGTCFHGTCIGDGVCFDDSQCGEGGTCYSRECVYASCLEAHEHHPALPNGTYFIWPEGVESPVEVYCDMTTDGGGYTFLLVHAMDQTFASGAERHCSERGMRLFVPRTEAHRNAALDIARDSTMGAGGTEDYLSILGIYPRWHLADCPNTPFNSDHCDRWRAGDDGPFYVSSREDIAQPDSGFRVSESMHYRWPEDGYDVSRYGDYLGEQGRTNYFICDVGDKWGGECSEDADCAGGEYCDRGACFAITSCLDLHEQDDTLPSGVYEISPEGSSDEVVEVYCDMTSDGGGYTLLKVDYGEDTNAAEAEEYCAELGMQLFVPRTEAHRDASLAVARDADVGPGGGDGYMHILGIYPDEEGASCSHTAFNSDSCDTWSASDDGPYFVSTREDLGEPNGDNGVDASMAYFWDADGEASYNDTASPGATSRYFMCDVADMTGP